MVRKIGISLRDDLYEWAAEQVARGNADSVSALVAEGLEILASRALLESLVADLADEIGELDEENRQRVEAALQAADEAHRRLLARKRGGAA